MLEHILNGGPLMVPLVLCSIVSLAVVYDRWAAFRANRRVDTRSLRAKVLAHLRNEEVDQAIAQCEAARGPLVSVLLAGLRSYDQLHTKGGKPGDDAHGGHAGHGGLRLAGHGPGQ